MTYVLPTDEEIIEDFEEELDMHFGSMEFAIARAKKAIDLLSNKELLKDRATYLRLMDNVEEDIFELTGEFRQVHATLEEIVQRQNQEKQKELKVEERKAFETLQQEWVID